jgi:hypothetical protein
MGIRVFLLAALMVVTAFPAPARADVQPGDVISPANAEKVKDLVSPAMYWCVQKGFPMRIIPTKKVELRRAFVEATEKYSNQVKLSADGLRLQNYVAGRPFPHIDVSDPLVAMKVMQNFSYAIAYDDLDLRNFDADTGPISTERPLQVERHFLIDHFRRLYYVGRLYVDPKPEIPNKEGYQYKETLHPLIEPFDLKGVGFTYYRYIDPAKQDDSWLYLPSLRRVRRLSTAQRSDALFGQDTDQDIYAVPYADMYDRAGELWKIWVNNFAFRKEAFPGARIKYEEDTPFPAAATMIDIQLEHATKASLPSHRFPGEPGWYWHQGAKEGTTEDQFTIAELIGSGH